MRDRAFIADVVALLDLVDGVDWCAPSDAYLWAFGALAAQIRGRIGACDRLPAERLHTNDAQVVAIALVRAGK
jgi:hypothetical protein